MSNIKGIAVSDGISIAKVYLLIETKLEIKQKKANSKEEIKKLKEAIKKSINELEKIKEAAFKKMGAEKAEIFTAHIQIANDTFLLDQYKAIINEQETNAEFAVSEIAKQNIELFKAMEDPYMRERAVDIYDVTNRIIHNLLGIPNKDLSQIKEEVIIVANDLTPSQTSQLDKKYVKGFATNIGGKTSHSAIMARSLEIPAVVGLGSITTKVKNNELIILDGINGIVVLNPNKKELTNAQNLQQQYLNEIKELEQFTTKDIINTLDNFKFKVFANIGSPKDIEKVIEVNADGIGLFRSEFLYMDNTNWPTEEEQFKAYKIVLEKMKSKFVVIRTLDIGGDKKLSYFNFPHEENPFLGYRAVRLTLDKKDVFKTQLRALLRASQFGNLGINIPMVAIIDEVKATKKLIDECKEELKKEKIPFGNPKIGIMVEIPSVAEIADKFANYVDFLSIGTNDLIQYTFAADRMSEKVSYLYQPLNPSLLHKLNRIITKGHQNNAIVAMCGEMASDLKAIPLLLGMNLDEFSVSATAVLKTKKLISKLNKKDCEELLKKALELETSSEVEKIVLTFFKQNNI